MFRKFYLLILIFLVGFTSLLGFKKSSTVWALTMMGDVNGDNFVDVVDIGILIDNYEKQPITNSAADVNSDGTVNIIDIGLVIDNYGRSQTPSPTSIGGDPVVMATSDIICDSLTTTGSSCQQKIVSDVILNERPNAVLIVGDICHTPSDNCFNNVYAPSYGRFKNVTYPVTGNHEYLASGAAPFFKYFSGVRPYYSFDVGSWHVVALNSQCSEVGGCGVGSTQYNWLQSDLSTHRNACTLAYYHIPVYSSGGRANSNMAAIFKLLYDNGVEIVLDGHDHIYERFAPQNGSGGKDVVRGVREFIVGTGGANHTNIASVAANSEIRNADSFGALKLILHQGSYSWQFIKATGNFSDSGSSPCH